MSGKLIYFSNLKFWKSLEDETFKTIVNPDILTLRRDTSEPSMVGIGGVYAPLWISGLGRQLGFPFGPVIDLHERS